MIRYAPLLLLLIAIPVHADDDDGPANPTDYFDSAGGNDLLIQYPPGGQMIVTVTPANNDVGAQIECGGPNDISFTHFTWLVVKAWAAWRASGRGNVDVSDPSCTMRVQNGVLFFGPWDGAERYIGDFTAMVVKAWLWSELPALPKLPDNAVLFAMLAELMCVAAFVLSRVIGENRDIGRLAGSGSHRVIAP